MNAKKIFSLLAIFLLIGTASAAVMVTHSPEARIYFGIDKPAEVEDVVTLGEMPGVGWTNSFEMVVNDTIVECALKHHNPRQTNITGDVHITIYCDVGLDLADDATIRDFESVEYTDINGIVRECDSFDYTAEITADTVTYIVPGFEFPEGYSDANIRIDLVGMAYGNYTCEIIVIEEV